MLHLFVRRWTNVPPASCVHRWLSLFHAPLSPLSSTQLHLPWGSTVVRLHSGFSSVHCNKYFKVGRNSVIEFVPVALRSR